MDGTINMPPKRMRSSNSSSKEDARKPLANQTSTVNITMPPKRKRFSDDKKDNESLTNQVKTVDMTVLPKRIMQWKPSMACKVVPSTRIKYLSSDEEDENDMTNADGPNIIRNVRIIRIVATNDVVTSVKPKTKRIF